MTRKMTDEHKAKIAEAKRGKIVTDETRALMSAQALARKRLVCPHCLKECAANMARRWHFENCKHKPQTILDDLDLIKNPMYNN